MKIEIKRSPTKSLGFSFSNRKLGVSNENLGSRVILQWYDDLFPDSSEEKKYIAHGKSTIVNSRICSQYNIDGIFCTVKQWTV